MAPGLPACYELDGLAGAPPAAPHLLLGVTHLNQTLAVKPTRTRRELGNLLVVAPTRGGKGLLAVTQLLTWRCTPSSSTTSRASSLPRPPATAPALGPVFVIDPTGVGHRLDPLAAKTTEDELFSAARIFSSKPTRARGRSSPSAPPSC